MKTGVQQIMLGTVCKNENETLSTLKRIKQAGYDGIELNGFMIRPTSFLVRALTKAAGMPAGKGGSFRWKELTEEAGLLVTSIHEDLGTIEREPEKVIAEAKGFGTKYAVITGMYRFDYTDPEEMKKLCRRLNESGRVLKESGVELLYHNHNIELQRVKGEARTAYDFLLEETNSDYVNFELDSYWPAEAGVDPLLLMEKLQNRMKLYHINDRGTRLSKTPMTPILKSDSMELGCGNMNLSALIRKAKESGCEAVILETHKNWVEGSPLASLEKRAEYLRENI